LVVSDVSVQLLVLIYVGLWSGNIML